jgi:hypothetical protein
LSLAIIALMLHYQLIRTSMESLDQGVMGWLAQLYHAHLLFFFFKVLLGNFYGMKK